MAVLGASACAGTGSSADPGSAPGTDATTTANPPGTVPNELRSGLLRLDEMRTIVAFGYDTREQPVLDPKQFALTTLRTPCGTPVATPFRADGGFKVFRSTVTLVIESMAEPGAAAAARFLEALRADAAPGCPSFEERLGVAPSRVETKRMLDLPALGDDRIGWAQTVTDESGRVGFRYIVAIRGAERVLLLAVLATTEVSADAMNDLAGRAARAT